MKKVFLITLLLAIFLAAHPVGILKTSSNAIRPILYHLGIDVYMQPITFDMMGMVDAEEHSPLYTHAYSLVYRQKDGEKILSTDDLSFLAIKAPLLWFLESHYENFNIPFHTYAICQIIKRVAGDVEGFKLKSSLNSSVAKRYGINLYQSCRKR